MPVTKTAKRALRSSSRKASFNSLIISKLEIAIRQAKFQAAKGTKGQAEAVRKAVSLADRAVKKNVIKKNKAARIKSSLSKLAKSTSKSKPKKSSKKK